MKINVYPVDSGGCGRYRMTYPAQAAIDAGADITLVDPDNDVGRVGVLKLVMQDRFDQGHLVHDIIDVVPPECDVAVFQRPLEDRMVQVIPLLQRHGIAVVIEMDDDFTNLHRLNQARVALENAPGNDARNPTRACKLADLVIVSTSALAKVYGGHGRVRVLPNLLPDHFLDTPACDPPGIDTRRVGWSGSVSTHHDDLEQTQGGIRDASPGEMYVVGSGIGVRERLKLYDATPFHAAGWQAIEDYPAHMASCGVGIVPLKLSPFNDAKSWLKGIEFAAVGVPFVASPTAEYRRLHALGAGLLASNRRQWAGSVRSLLNDPSRAQEVALRGREAVEPLRYSRQYDRWLEAWGWASVLHGRRANEHRRALV